MGLKIWILLAVCALPIGCAEHRAILPIPSLVPANQPDLHAWVGQAVEKPVCPDTVVRFEAERVLQPRPGYLVDDCTFAELDVRDGALARRTRELEILRSLRRQEMVGVVQADKAYRDYVSYLESRMARSWLEQHGLEVGLVVGFAAALGTVLVGAELATAE